MKELRSVGGHLRLLFAFDPRRTAIVLLGGDKTGDWAGWYERNIPIADDLYDAYLVEIERKGWSDGRAEELEGRPRSGGT
jgi:hypothetical protein